MLFPLSSWGSGRDRRMSQRTLHPRDSSYPIRMTIVVAWADIINKNVRTPCHPEATGRRISQRANRPRDSSHTLRMTIVVAWADIINKNVRIPCHPEATGRRISQSAVHPGGFFASDQNDNRSCLGWHY